MNLPDFLAQDKYGYIHVAGHRIGLSDIVYLYQDGHSAKMVANEFPTLPLRLVQQVVAFYLANKAEVDVYAAREMAEIEKQRARAPQGPDMAELRRRYKSRRRAEAK